jgi:hypothetical protein
MNNPFPTRTLVKLAIANAEKSMCSNQGLSYLDSKILVKASRAYLLMQSANDANIGSIKHMENLLAEQKLQNQKLQEQLDRWKTGCLANADDAKDAARQLDERRLQIGELKLQNASLREALESGQEIVFEGSRHMAIPVSTVEESLATTPTNAMDCVREIVATIERNHKWHQEGDDYGGYAESDLWEENMRAIAKAKEVFGV